MFLAQYRHRIMVHTRTKLKIDFVLQLFVCVENVICFQLVEAEKAKVGKGQVENPFQQKTPPPVEAEKARIKGPMKILFSQKVTKEKDQLKILHPVKATKALHGSLNNQMKILHGVKARKETKIRGPMKTPCLKILKRCVIFRIFFVI